MYSPRPYGLFGPLGQGDQAAVDALVRQLTNYKDAAGLDSLKWVKTLPSGATVVAVDMGGTLRVLVSAPGAPPATPTSDGTAQLNVPMLFSGVVASSAYRQGQGITLNLTSQTCRRLAGYTGAVAAQQTLQRFAITYSSQFSEFVQQDDGSSPFTPAQYTLLKPTWYSGLAAALVQTVGGYGRQDLQNLPANAIERAVLRLPRKVSQAVAQQMGTVRLPGYTGLPPSTGQIQLDYKFGGCNGVARDSSGQSWLVRINTLGVYIMPLPLVPATTTPAFRAYIEQMNDDEILWLLDTFGGMPSGEQLCSKSIPF